jgi:hypothetical protein
MKAATKEVFIPQCATLVTCTTYDCHLRLLGVDFGKAGKTAETARRSWNSVIRFLDAAQKPDKQNTFISMRKFDVFEIMQTEELHSENINRWLGGFSKDSRKVYTCKGSRRYSNLMYPEESLRKTILEPAAHFKRTGG